MTVHVIPPQVDPSNSGRVAASDAALFLKTSGLADLVLGKVTSIKPHVSIIAVREIKILELIDKFLENQDD